MIVGLGGNVGGDAVEKIEQLLGDLPAAETGDPRRRRPGHGPRVKIHTNSPTRPPLHRRAQLPLAHPTATSCSCSRPCSNRMSSRLFTEVRERRGLAYYVFGINHSSRRGLALLAAGVDINRADEAVETIARELQRSSTSGRVRRVEKSRNLAKAASCCSSRTRRDDHVRPPPQVLEGEAVDPQAVQEGLDAVTAQDIQRVPGR